MALGLRMLAFDLGAESGRVILGTLDADRLSLDEVYRFPNEPVELPDGLHWDVLRLFHEIKRGLSLAIARYGCGIASLGIDTWGVDFGLLGEGDVLLGNPYHYRDHRTDGILEEAFRILPKQEIFRRTAVQFLPFNSLYQLWVWSRTAPLLVRQARTFLMMPDLFNFFLTGQKLNEFTNATTTQMYDPVARTWSREILSAFNLPEHIFSPPRLPGTIIGGLRSAVAREVGLTQDLPVVAVASHDTASAVGAVPSDVPDYAYISSGTWSVVGTDITEPIINDATEAYGFSSCGGVGGTFCLLKNVMGLWLVQQCRRSFDRDGSRLSYDELTEMAAAAKPLTSVVDPDADAFLNPDDMPKAIQQYCKEHGQLVPQTRGEIVRCALESLALKYRWVLEKMEIALGKRLRVIHIVGGGTRNALLCQLTADATGRPVFAGPVEGTATANTLVQAMALGKIRTLYEVRKIVRRSFDLTPYEPRPNEAWDRAYKRFVTLLGEER